MNDEPTLVHILRERAREQPDHPYVTLVRGSAEAALTFGALYRGARRFASAYRTAGVNRGDIILFMLEHGEEQYTAFFGAMLAGAVPSFMPFPSAKQDPVKFWRDHEALFARIRPALLVTYAANAEAARAALHGGSVQVLVADAAGSETSTPFDDVLPEPGDVACLQHSSGTTGLKKGVMLTHAAIVAHVRSYAGRLAFTSHDVIASWLPLYHDMGFIACFLMPLIIGAHVVALDPFVWVVRPAMLLDAIGRHRATFCWQPNFAFSHLVNTTRPNADYDLSSVRAFINCSEPCKAATFERFRSRFESGGLASTALQVSYAMAENVFAVTQTVANRSAAETFWDGAQLAEGRLQPANGAAARRLLSCGPPIDGVEVEVRDPNGAVAGGAAFGQLFIRSPFLFSGYYGLPDETARKLQNGWYATGDVGFMFENDVYVTGRIDDMLIVNGRNYYAHEIEEIVNGVSGVVPGRNVALGIEDDRADATVVVVMAESRDMSAESVLSASIRKEVLDHLGLALHGVIVAPLGTLVKTTSGKISRAENRARYMSLKGSQRT